MGLGCASRLSVPSGSCPSEDETSRVLDVPHGSVCLPAHVHQRTDLVGLGVHPSSVAKRRQHTTKSQNPDRKPGQQNKTQINSEITPKT